VSAPLTEFGFVACGNLHFTLKENTLKRSDLDDFVACYNPKSRTERKESERFKAFTYDELRPGGWLYASARAFLQRRTGHHWRRSQEDRYDQ